MPVDLDGIASDNIRKYGTDIDRYGPVLLANLYSDRTHFIFELLQNAEDAGATSVHFALHRDRLCITHNGRPFDDNDVRGICGLVEGTKSQNWTKIGKFGIGFKSVYAYTQRPQIHSGDEHFCVENYVLPRPIAPLTVAPKETYFAFPFDHADVSAEEAFERIKERISLLDPTSLLFLRNIREIAWSVEGAGAGKYRCTGSRHGSLHTVTVGSLSGGKTTKQDWLIFRKAVPIPEKAEVTQEQIFVEIAYWVERDESGQEQIRRISESPLVVYFATEKPTGLGFLVQGPYVTTPARDNVPAEHPWNVRLVRETALLVSDSLRQLKKAGVLSVKALDAMPLDVGLFPEKSMFRPIYDEVRAVLHAEELLPAQGRGYVAGKNAKLAHSTEMARLFNPQRLKLMLGLKGLPRWLSPDITAHDTPALYSYLAGRKRQAWDGPSTPALVEDLEVRPEDIAENLSDHFMREQSDSWVKELYAYLRSVPEIHDALKQCPVIRLSNGQHVAAVDSHGTPAAFLPSKGTTGYPTVKRSLLQNSKALDFLKKLGLTEPDVAAEVLKRVLPKYSVPQPRLSRKEHASDLERIKAAMAARSPLEEELRTRLRDIAFLRARNARSPRRFEFRRACEIYAPSDSLTLYFEGNKDAWFLDEAHDDLPLWIELGLRTAVKVECRQPDREGHVILSEESRHHARGLDGFDPECQIDGLEHALRNPTQAKSMFIWNEILPNHARSIKGIVQKAMWWTYKNANEEEQYSLMGQLLVDAAWLPDEDGHFHRQADCSLEDLPVGFVRNASLAEQLGMRPTSIRTLAKESGIDEEVLNLLRQLGLNSATKLRERLGLNADADIGDETEVAVTKLDHDFGSGEDQTGTRQSIPRPKHQKSDQSPEADGPIHEPVAATTPPRTPGGSLARTRFNTYVSAHETEPHPGNGEAHAKRLALEEEAIRLIIEEDGKQFPQIRRMPPNNEGYDLEAIDENGKIIRYIEVKALVCLWRDRPATLSESQFRMARRKGESFWLYVVERAGGPEARIHRVQAPADRVKYFTYDEGWGALR